MLEINEERKRLIKSFPKLPPGFYYDPVETSMNRVRIKKRDPNRKAWNGYAAVAYVLEDVTRLGPPGADKWTTTIEGLSFEDGLRVAVARLWLEEY